VPITAHARVMVNRLWQWHFGDGLVRSSDNFGLLGEVPTHPELLDWLARRFVEDGWAVKRMQRRVMLSAVYQQGHDVARRQREGEWESGRGGESKSPTPPLAPSPTLASSYDPSNLLLSASPAGGSPPRKSATRFLLSQGSSIRRWEARTCQLPIGST
jgi:hypothetical protein